MKILVVDDEPIMLSSIRRLLRRRGLSDVAVCDNGAEAIARIKDENFDMVLLDLLMPEVDGLQVLRESKPFQPDTEFIILTAVDDVDMAVKAIRLGAYDYLVKPIDNDRLLLSMERAFEHRGLLAGLAGSGGNEESLKIPEAFSHVVTRDPRMIELLSFAGIMAKSGNPILITGESGTGKELLARGIHQGGPGRNGPFVAVNVSAVPENLFESQFFGHLKGSFTGAMRDHVGFFQQADSGTLFLDEIGELPMELQTKLLRVLEEKEVTPVGATKPVPVHLQIVSATNVDINDALKTGKFRLDLLYRLKSAHIHLPPLRERKGDIPVLASHFLTLSCQRHNKRIAGFTPEALDMLVRKEYRGNVRSLVQSIENGVIMCDAGQITPRHLGMHLETARTTASSPLNTLKENRNRHVAYILDHTHGNRKQAAEILGVTVRHVHRILSQMKEDPEWKSYLQERQL